MDGDRIAEVVDFWREAGRERWFTKDAAFDRRFRERFLDLHLTAARGELGHWLATADGALALMVLLDQYPRNSFRGTAHMYATDPLARAAALQAIEAGHDQAFPAELRVFFYLPFSHSEVLEDQQRAVALGRLLGADYEKHAVRHHDIVARFGRFPHRNPIMGRDTTGEERAFLDEGGFSG